MSELLCIGTKTVDDSGFQFYQTVLIQKVLENTWTDHCNRLPTPTKVETQLGTDKNVPKDKRGWNNSYTSIIGKMLYLESNTRSDISFDIHQCEWSTHNTNASNDNSAKRLCWYFQGTKCKGLMFNLYKKIVMDTRILNILCVLRIELDLR